jgi:hypothetical protein
MTTNSEQPSLNQTLKSLGYVMRPSGLPGQRHILKGRELLFTGSAHEVWGWLEEQANEKRRWDPAHGLSDLMGRCYESIQDSCSAGVPWQSHTFSRRTINALVRRGLIKEVVGPGPFSYYRTVDRGAGIEGREAARAILGS